MPVPPILYRGDSDPPADSRLRSDMRSMRLAESWTRRGLIARLGHGGRGELAPTRPLARRLFEHIHSTSLNSTFISFTSDRNRARDFMRGDPRLDAQPQHYNWNGLIIECPTANWDVCDLSPSEYECRITGPLGVVQEVLLIDALRFLVDNDELQGAERDRLIEAAREDAEWIVWLGALGVSEGDLNAGDANALLYVDGLASATTFGLSQPKG